MTPISEYLGYIAKQRFAPPQIVWDPRFLQAVPGEKRKLLLREGTFLRVETTQGLRLFENTKDKVIDVQSKLDVGETLTNGADYYVFLVPTADGLDIKVSLNKVKPQGYDVGDVQRIAGFHTMCVNLGNDTPVPRDGSTHRLKGFSAGDIVPTSSYTLTFRPKSEAEGMGFSEVLRIWGDYYIQSGVDGALTSKFGGTIVHTRQFRRHMNDMRMCGKRLPTLFEYAELGRGGNENTSIVGGAIPNPDTSGGHKDTAGKFMVSHLGMWETQGFRWHMLDECSFTGQTNWRDIDGGVGLGQSYGDWYKGLAGGYYGDGSYCGSWAVLAHHPASNAYASHSARGVSDHIEIPNIFDLSKFSSVSNKPSV